MEVARIEWKKLEWRFVEDDLYEHFNAPKWFDFHSPHLSDSILAPADDWFCRPDCNHPNTSQDFSLLPSQLATTPTHRDFGSPCSNLSTPPTSHMSKTPDNSLLKTTLSARNLFAGRDFLTHITDFCHDLKRMAIKPKDDENTAQAQQQYKQDESSKVKVLAERKKTTTAVLKEKKIRIPRHDDSENIPISVNLENVKPKDENLLLQIRTNPPSPQCFTATKKPIPSKSKLMERVGVQDQNNKQVLLGDKHKCVASSIVESKETKPLDVFWFLKPCTLSDYNSP